MINSTNLPSDIIDTLIWFSNLITSPTLDQSFDKEIQTHILPSKQLSSIRRIEIYNNHYWWRLIKFLQEKFPLTFKLLGSKLFHEYSRKYLLKYHPDHWSLTPLGDHFPLWLQENIPQSTLIHHAAEIDLIFYQIAFAEPKNPLTLSDHLNPETTLILQPFLRLSCFPYDLANYRELILNGQNAEITETHLHYYLFIRNHKCKMAWKHLDFSEYAILQHFKSGMSISIACRWISQQPSELQTSLTQKFPQMIQSWIKQNWLTLQSNSL